MSNEVDDFVIFMYGRIRHVQYAMWRWRRYKTERLSYLRSHAYVSRCEDCKCLLSKKRRRASTPWLDTAVTIDHIVPLWVCREYDLPELEFDPRNYRIVCARCNSDRGNMEDRLEMLDLPDGMLDQILRASQTWQKKRASLLAAGPVLK